MASKTNDKKYLVTGGTGFIGSALVRRLVNDGYVVRVLDNDLRGAAIRLKDLEGAIELVTGDVRDANIVQRACKGMDSVIHLAYLNGTEFFYSKPELVLEIGVKGMINIIDACLQEGIKEFVLASSSEVYQTPPFVPTDENVPLSVPDPMNPRYSYGGGKIISELLVINYGRKYFDRVLIFRPHNVYGPDMGWEHVIPQFALRMQELCEQVEVNKPVPFPIQGSGLETRSFIYIDDFTNGLMAVIERGEHMNIYHIGTMDEIAIGEVAKKVGHYFGKEIELMPGAIVEGGTKRRCPDITKLSRLGFEPNISIDEGIRITTEWYANNSHKRKNKGGLITS